MELEYFEMLKNVSCHFVNKFFDMIIFARERQKFFDSLEDRAISLWNMIAVTTTGAKRHETIAFYNFLKSFEARIDSEKVRI